jgi:hypothetical protein
MAMETLCLGFFLVFQEVVSGLEVRKEGFERQKPGCRVVVPRAIQGICPGLGTRVTQGVV